MCCNKPAWYIRRTALSVQGGRWNGSLSPYFVNAHLELTPASVHEKLGGWPTFAFFAKVGHPFFSSEAFSPLPASKSPVTRKHRSEFSAGKILAAWGRILGGRVPMLSIEITRECPLHCPGCYAYGDTHLGGEVTLRELADFRGQKLVDGVLELVRKHRPLQVSLVGGEPLVRHRELSQILPVLSRMGVFAMVVTSAVIPIPEEWMSLPRVLVAVSIDGLPEHHDIRRKPATYERILKNIAGRRVNIHWTVTKPMLERAGYIEEYVSFWNARPEVSRIWVSVYSPQQGEQAPEILSADDRRRLLKELLDLRTVHPKLLFNEGIAQAFQEPPANPKECLFSKMSVNYTADLKTRVEPCIFGGTPDCSQCGCAISTGLHWLKSISVAGPLKIDHFVRGSIAVGSLVNRLNVQSMQPSRWEHGSHNKDQDSPLVQIG
jgi:sulfatase maturation enzyme AslB (radical SAM superfamily)